MMIKNTKAGGITKWNMMYINSFWIEDTIDTDYKYKSNQSGVIGLGPYTANIEGNKGVNDDINFMKGLVDKKIIDSNIVSFNISFPKTFEEWEKDSYIYLGQISDKIG